ncbi:hypothetical protein I6N95_03630 [Vagococcus sp. BWB3-3]|uniref:Uncharacterized protein n=1 Tax=Vagococcus allomyrinae TaxID=2794353 RepID=A0A940P9S1_9ENTE|nr:hypothetical protein [Vagococcus allomyrinae]MBP1040098.1 hypothetical protein [Vagococcus allomyrinae]
MTNSKKIVLTFRNQHGHHFKTSVSRFVSGLDPVAFFEELSDIPMVNFQHSQLTSKELSAGYCAKASYVTTTKTKLIENIREKKG